jgi:phospholipid/cholesterol/gamma-HCH transport system ATP-binding protein
MPEQQNIPIQVNGLHKSFGKQTVLDGMELDVREAETVAVMGRSGTGKSVLLKLMMGLQPADSGSIRICGKEIGSLPENELNEVRKKMGFLFQQAALYDSMTIEQNVIFPMARHTRKPAKEQKERARQLLSSVGMDDKDNEKLPSQISGGMQKRVGLARALALDPEILLCDEPTSGLDPITASEIACLIVGLKKKRRMTAVVVTHDLRGARAYADRIVLIHEGKVVAQGTIKDLQESKDKFVVEFLRDSL